jgi:hypothetical protein
VSIQDLLTPAFRGRQFGLEDMLSLSVVVEPVCSVEQYQVPVPNCEGEDGRIQLFDKGFRDTGTTASSPFSKTTRTIEILIRATPCTPYDVFHVVLLRYLVEGPTFLLRGHIDLLSEELARHNCNPSRVLVIAGS